MSFKRKLVKINTPQKEPGFLGEGHTARFFVKGDYKDTDPFIYLMDEGVYIRLYSGSLEGISSPVQNYVPLIVAELIIQPNSTASLKIPADFNAFIVAISGNVEVGEEKHLLAEEQVGWLDHNNENNQSELLLKAVKEEVRLVLYAAKPLGEPIVSQGPFIADNAGQIQKVYQEYSMGQMKHIAEMPSSQRITY